LALPESIARVGRTVLRAGCRLPLPGRHTAVETLASWLRPGAPVLIRDVSGLELRCDLTDHVQRQVYYGLYEAAETRIIRSLLRPGSIFFDLGANVGYFTLLAASAVGPAGQVHAFEPITENTDVITWNLTHNCLRNTVVNTVGVSDGSTATLLVIKPLGFGSSAWASITMTHSDDNTEPVTVPAVAIDDYVAQHVIAAVTLMKIDVEGAEMLALRGAERLLSRPDAPDVICEVNPRLLRRIGIEPHEVSDRLRGHGYALRAVTQRGLKSVPTSYRQDDVTTIFASKR
jgi:FkbM family methyltransferase